MHEPIETYARIADIPQIQYTAIEVKAGEDKVCPNCNTPVNAASYYRIRQRGYCSKCKNEKHQKDTA